MSFKGMWGVQNHMPFTGGTYLTRMLRKTGDKGTRFGNMHDLPVTEWSYDREFMTIRQIPEWYRSAHGYMSPNWRCGGTDSQMWNIVSARMVHCADNNFDNWMMNIQDKYPGLCSWVYNMYAVPRIELIHLDDVDKWLLANFNIESDNEIRRNSHKDPKVIITSQVRTMCELAENPLWWELTRSRQT